MGNPINHGTKNDFNIIVDLTYDKAGRRTSLRDPRGNLTEYDYDLLNRRVELTNPLSKTWTTAYTDMGGGGSRTTLTDPNGINTQRDFDRAGRVQSIQFGNPSNTPDVQFAYDEAGNRERMSEFSGSGFTSKVRETTFTYDDLRRVTAVDFDTDGNGSVEESVSYEYDAAGLKTKMTLPGSLEITYDYDANGRLIGMTDWDAQTSEFGYDLSGRHIVTHQDNGLRSRYSYDADGRLITLRHTAGERTLGHFAYHYDKRGNRIRAFEALPHPATTSDTTLDYNDDAVEYRGTWTNSAPYKQTTVFGASLKLAFFGTDATLTVGTGVNHTRFDIYINRQLWQTVDAYAASNGTLDIPIALENEGPHLLEIRNRPQHSQAAKQDGAYDPAVYKLRFKQLLVPDLAYDLHTIEYVYDALSRVEDVNYYAGRNLSASPFRTHAYTYDRLGNRLSASLNGGGATNYTYNPANQLTNDGTNSYTYDNNGNLTNDGVNTHTWDRANRLKSVGNHSYAYDGLGNRVKKTVSGTATSYLLDLHCSLTKVLAQTTSSNTDRVLHGPRGVQAFEDSTGDWSFMLPDALGSVRSQVDDTLAIAGIRTFEPYGDPFGEQGSFAGDYGFTGEQTDANDLLFLRARYYNPNMATFTGLDPHEGSWNNPLTLNAYGYVGGNPINRTDPTGMFWDNAPNLMKPDGGGSGKPIKAPPKNEDILPEVTDNAGSLIGDAITSEPIGRINGTPKPIQSPLPAPNCLKVCAAIPGSDLTSIMARIVCLLACELCRRVDCSQLVPPTPPKPAPDRPRILPYQPQPGNSSCFTQCAPSNFSECYRECEAGNPPPVGPPSDSSVFEQPFGPGVISVVITSYGATNTVAFPNGVHYSIDIVPASAYGGNEIDPEQCPPTNWADNRTINVYAGVDGVISYCDASSIQIRTENFEYVYTHVSPAITTCNGSVEVSANALIGTLEDPSSPGIIYTNTLTHLDLAIYNRNERVGTNQLDPTPYIHPVENRVSSGQCRP